MLEFFLALLKRDPIDAAGTIGDALAATNRVSLSESKRLELAEKYYTTALTLTNGNTFSVDIDQVNGILTIT